MKKLTIINNYQIEFPKHRKDNFQYVFNSIGRKLNVSYVNFEDLNENKSLNTVLNSDGIILTGSELNLSDISTVEKMKKVIFIIQNFNRPLLGICFGHQLIGHAFGFEVDYMENVDSEWDKILMLKVEPNYDLIDRKEISVEVTHQQEIKFSPNFEKQFRIFSSSLTCKIHIIKHLELPIYGVQFHPETNKSNLSRENGLELFQNFISLI